MKRRASPETRSHGRFASAPPRAGRTVADGSGSRGGQEDVDLAVEKLLNKLANASQPHGAALSAPHPPPLPGQE